MGEFAVGQSVSRFEDPRLLRGGGRYVDDIAMPRMAFGYVLRSPHAHARIRKIDTAHAVKAPGVLAVLTGKDLEDAGLGDLPVPGGLKRRDGRPGYRQRYPALVLDRVRYTGDCVAFIVAETLNQALDAAERIEVDYEPLPAVIATADATAPGAPLVWDDCEDNIGFVQTAGDEAATEAAFAAADHIVNYRFVINRVTAASLEPRGCIGQFDPADGRYTLHTTLQRPYGYRADLSRIFKVPESKIHVIAGDIGGSFGMKSAIYNEVVLVLIAAQITGRPVKWISTRSEAFLSDAQGRDNVVEASLALDKDGKFLAMRAETKVCIGAFLQSGMPTFFLNIGSLVGVYTIPAAYADVTAVYTHTNPVRPYRGNRRPEVAYVIERLVDIAADQMGIDPGELRRRNYIGPAAMPYKTSLTFTYDSGEFEKCMDLALKLADVSGLEKRRRDARERGKLLGFGISNTVERAAAYGFEGAEIRFNRTGTVTLLAGSVSHGQGHETIYKQIVCDRLGLDPSEVQYVQGDTDQIFFGEGTGGSRSATIGGSAFHVTANKIVEKAQAIAAHVFKVEPEDVQFVDGLFSTSGTNQTLTVQDVARIAANPDNLPATMEGGLIASTIFNTPHQNFPNGCHICEVEIDVETGAAEIVGYSVVDDVGVVINPLLLKGQITGGIAQGAGQALMEDVHFEPTSGQLLTGSFLDYAMPRARDFCNFQVESNPVPTATNPLGVKGAGEAGSVGALPAVANAIVDALSEFGVSHIEMPATSERIWRAMSQGSSMG